MGKKFQVERQCPGEYFKKTRYRLHVSRRREQLSLEGFLNKKKTKSFSVSSVKPVSDTKTISMLFFPPVDY